MRAYDLGLWCFQTRQPPHVWRELTRTERDQFVIAAQAARKSGW